MPKNQLEKLNKLFELVDTDHASTAEVTEIFQAILTAIDQLKGHLEQKVAENGVLLKDSITELKDNLESDRAKLKLTVAQNQAQNKQELDQLAKQFFVKVKELQALIPTIPDLTPLEDKIAKVEQKISELPESLNGKQIRDELERLKNNERLDKGAIKGLDKQLDELNKKIDNLEQRTMKGFSNIPRGGGVSALGVRQAFKMIFHTEAPSGDIDGANTQYTVKHEIFAVLDFSLNGETIAELPNYTITGRTITFSTALPSAFSGKDFEVKYIG